MITKHIDVDEKAIRAFCKKWRVVELALFGSVVRDDFGPDSDVDVLVSFEENPNISLWDMTTMSDELEAMFGRKVDLVTKEGLVNPYRRYSILTTREVIYAV